VTQIAHCVWEAFEGGANMPNTIADRANRMKQVLVAMCLVLASGPAYGEWELITMTADFETTAYVDFSTLRQKGHLVTMWELLDYAIAQPGREPHLSYKGQRENDCREPRTRFRRLIFYSGPMGRGKVVDAYVYPDTEEWEPVVPDARPDSVTKTLWDAACKRINIKGKK
jgi:hypothetical protein